MPAASSGVAVGNASYMPVGAIMGVLTSGMYTVVIETLSSTISDAIERENASSALLLATYAEKRGVFVCAPIEDTLMTWPDFRSRIPGRKPMISFSAPK